MDVVTIEQYNEDEHSKLDIHSEPDYSHNGAVIAKHVVGKSVLYGNGCVVLQSQEQAVIKVSTHRSDFLLDNLFIINKAIGNLPLTVLKIIHHGYEVHFFVKNTLSTENTVDIKRIDDYQHCMKIRSLSKRK